MGHTQVCHPSGLNLMSRPDLYLNGDSTLSFCCFQTKRLVRLFHVIPSLLILLLCGEKNHRHCNSSHTYTLFLHLFMTDALFLWVFVLCLPCPTVVVVVFVVFACLSVCTSACLPFCLSVHLCLSVSRQRTIEESDSDSDEELDGGTRHDLMMNDEKVRCLEMFAFVAL